MPPAAPALAHPRILVPAAVAAAVLAAVAVLASLGGPQGPVQGLAAVVMWCIRAGAAPAACILGAAGLGRLARPLFRDARDAWALQLAVGLGLMLTLSHGMGIARLFAGPWGHYAALAPIGAGVILLAHQLLVTRALQTASIVLPATALPALGGGAILLVAACNPPGWLWESEFGGFDALEYHLQLPQEWLARGWLWPLNHNVYSFLPSYVEAAYLHLGALLGAPTMPTAASPMVGLLYRDGAGVISCQLLHAAMTLCAAVLIGRAARLAAERSGLGGPAASAGAGIAASLYLLTPWTIVTGSLAYNEGAMTALGAGALIAALDDRLPPIRRAILAGFLVGIAASAKPTALTMIGAPVGLLLLGLAPTRRWPAIVGVGAAAGLLALAPWLARNWYACGNPVFPFAASLFGTAHWTTEQAARFAQAHAFDGSILDRFRLMFLPDATDPAGPVHRGLFHGQWFLFFPLATAGVAGAIAHPATRRLGTILALGLAAQLDLWLFTTHIQSRFLIPLALTGSLAFGLALAAHRPRRLATTAAVLATCAQGIAAAWIFSQQRSARPNMLLLDGPAALSGESGRTIILAAPPEERARALAALPPYPFVNIGLPPGRRVYLLGDSTPMYLRFPLIWHTTWDTSPLGLVMRAAPDDPDRWSARIRAEGIEFILVNFAELDRLRRSGWYDPVVTPEAVHRWLDGRAAVLRAWPETGQALFHLAPPTEGAR